MLKIEGKTFMNLQEAVQWLLDNNALPFQCSADYQANTEIGLGTIVNPTPAKVRIGSLIFFADSKVSTVIGLTENGFICSDQYNDLVDDVVYVSNVALDGSGHLIVTLSDGNTIDAGLIKQVSNFSIDASQHLIANYNDGTSTDLGAIFSGNIYISGNLTVAGVMSCNSRLKRASGDIDLIYTGNAGDTLSVTNLPSWLNCYFAKISTSNGKLNIIFAFSVAENAVMTPQATYMQIAEFEPASAIFDSLYPVFSNIIDVKQQLYSSANAIYTDTDIALRVTKDGAKIKIALVAHGSKTAPINLINRFEFNFTL